MREDVLLLHRLPVECFPASRFRVRYAGGIFARPEGIPALLARAGREPFPNGISYAVRALLGRLVDDPGLVLFTTPGTHSEHRTVLSLARARGARVREVFLPRAAADTERFLRELLALSGTSMRVAEAAFRRMRDSRRRLCDDAAAGALSGVALDRAALDLAAGVPYRGTARRPRRLRRVAVAGGPSHPALLAALEARGAECVLTEESFREWHLAEARDLVSAWETFPHPGVAAAERGRRFGERALRFGAEAVLFLLLPLSHEGLECDLFREACPLPALPVELSDPAAVDRRTLLRLEAFLELA